MVNSADDSNDGENLSNKHICDSLTSLESKRLDDLKHSRETIFKFALPSTIIDGAAGALAALLTGNILVLLPVLLLVVWIYFLANGLDKRKYLERIQIIKYTETNLHQTKQMKLQ